MFPVLSVVTEAAPSAIFMSVKAPLAQTTFPSASYFTRNRSEVNPHASSFTSVCVPNVTDEPVNFPAAKLFPD